MKINKLIVVVVAAVFALVGCSKDNSDSVTGGTKGASDIFLQFSEEGLSRAVADEVADDTVPAFAEGGLFFVDENDVITRYIRITASNATGSLTAEKLKKGTIVENVSNTSVKIYVVGNFDFGDEDSFVNMDEVRDFTTNLTKQSDVKYGVANATLFGAGNIVDFTGTLPAYQDYVAAGGTETAEKEVIAKVRPLIARFEIDKMTATAGVHDYTLAGIYIDNFYYTVDITGQLHATDSELFHFDGTIADFARENNGGKYYDGTGSHETWYKLLFDDNDELGFGACDTTDKDIEAPRAGTKKQTWAYNFFPIAETVPHIVLHLTDVEVYGADGTTPETFVNSVTGDDTAFLTVRKYFQVSNDATVNFEGGWIYKIRDLEFTSDDLGEEPGGPDPDDEFTVWVEVQIINWRLKDIYVGF